MVRRPFYFHPELTRQHFRACLFKPYLTYVRKFYPEINLENIVTQAGLSIEYLSNKHNWVSLTFEKRFREALENQIHERGFDRKVGTYGIQEKAIGEFAYFLLRHIPLPLSTKYIPQIITLFNKTIKIECIQSNHLQIRFLVQTTTTDLTPSEQRILRERLPHHIENIIGYLSISPTLLETPGDHFKVEYIDKDNYYISIQYLNKNIPKIKKRFINFLSLMALSYTALFIITNKYNLPLKVSVLFSILFLLALIFKDYLFNKKSQKSIAKGLETIDTEINKLQSINQGTTRQFFQNMNLMNIAKKISLSNSEWDVLDSTCQALARVSPPSRSAAFLFNTDKTQLNYVSGYGLSEHLENKFKTSKISTNIKATNLGNFPRKVSRGNLSIKDMEPATPDSKPPTIVPIKPERPCNQSVSGSQDLLELIETSLTMTPLETKRETYGILLHDLSASEQPMADYNMALMGSIGSQASLAIERLRDQRHLQEVLDKNKELSDSYSKLISPEMLDTMGYKDISQIKLGDSKLKKATVLFNDIRGFTSICESAPKTHVLQFLNSYYQTILPIISKHNGILDKFIGDCLMAIFFNPRQGVKASIEIQETLLKSTFYASRAIHKPISTSIGLAQGEVVFGPMGDSNHVEITIFSDTVNIASRLCGLCKSLKSDILVHGISKDDLLNGHEDILTVSTSGWEEIRGKKNPVKVIGVTLQKWKDPKDKFLTTDLGKSMNSLSTHKL